ncbi:MAG: UDP-glucose 4-epimerase GalE [Burkholderiales bacterium]|nr:UDP-glucose 4-epimerase GalE [Burkholderiales bacterium]
MARILVTGGAGYIGSHTMVELLAAGHDVVCLDNFSNSSPEAVKRVQEIAGREVRLFTGDIRDRSLLDSLFHAVKVDAVIHFAALKAVGESVAKPLAYYENNVAGTLTLLEAMRAAHVMRIVFSSSATVYGNPDKLPITEDAPVRPFNPYGQTKAMVEQILRDWCVAEPGAAAVALRYFNPVGAHPSGRIGEDPADIPNNLFPFITQVAIGKRERLSVFGNDWPTVDGTGVRDYLHVVDLALGHVKALDWLARDHGFVAINLGTGQGTSVLEMVHAFESATGAKVPHTIVARRPGDIAACWADASLAHRLLHWQATRSLEDLCASGWRWQQANPEGYRTV